jgi:hypothetical protein
VRTLKEMSGPPKSRCNVRQRRTWDHLPGARPHGDRVPVVVAAVTTRHGDGNTVSQGEEAQVIGHPRTERYAKCRTLKRYWASSGTR